MTETSASLTADHYSSLAREYQAAAVLAAAADLDVFSALRDRFLTGPELAVRLSCNPRGLAILLDALVAIRLLVKQGETYGLQPGSGRFLAGSDPDSILPMIQHQANCLRKWARLAEAVRSGQPVSHTPSVRGAEGDQEAFIGAMHAICSPLPDGVIQSLAPVRFKHLLDIGGASGTWTMVFLRACPTGSATLFDLPHVIPLAKSRLTAAGLEDRVRLTPGDFNHDPLPSGADMVWVSAIIHQNSRTENRQLFGKAFTALEAGGRIAIRDILMEPDRTRPVMGALFAVNMLVATPVEAPILSTKSARI